MENHHQLWNECDRALSDEERRWISKLLSVDFKGRDALLDQFRTARVVGACGCGCKTVDIRVDKNCSKFVFQTRVPVEMMTNMTDGVPVVFYLHVVGGYVTELEVFRADSGQISEYINIDRAVVAIDESHQ